MTVAAFTAAFLYALGAEAAQCGKTDKVVGVLGSKYAERVVGMGVVGTRGFMQLFVAETGTWTVLLTTPEGISCIIAAGDSYEALDGAGPAVPPDTY